MVGGTVVVRLRMSESIGTYRSTLTLNDEGAGVVTEKTKFCRQVGLL